MAIYREFEIRTEPNMNAIASSIYIFRVIDVNPLQKRKKRINEDSEKKFWSKTDLRYRQT